MKGPTALHPKLVAKKQREILNQRPENPFDTRFKTEIVRIEYLILKGQADLHPKVAAKNNARFLISDHENPTTPFLKPKT